MAQLNTLAPLGGSGCNERNRQSPYKGQQRWRLINGGRGEH
jgi:hypothetical protein